MAPDHVLGIPTHRLSEPLTAPPWKYHPPQLTPPTHWARGPVTYSVTWMVLPHRDREVRMKVPAWSVVWKT